jgi:hypothetical protein
MQRRTYVFLVAQVLMVIAFLALVVTPPAAIPLGLSRPQAETIVGTLFLVCLIADGLTNRFWAIRGALTRRDRHPAAYWLLLGAITALLIYMVLVRLPEQFAPST